MSEEEKIERLLNSIAKGCDGSIADEIKVIIIKQQREIEDLNEELEIRIKWQQYFEKEYINKDKIKAKIKELEKQNEENKIELAKGIDMLSSNIIEKAKNNITINMCLRDILKELLEED